MDHVSNIDREIENSHERTELMYVLQKILKADVFKLHKWSTN